MPTNNGKVKTRKEHEISCMLNTKTTKKKRQTKNNVDSTAALIVDQKAYHMFLDDILGGTFSAKSLIDAAKATGKSIDRLRPIALSAYQTVRYCQSLSENDEEQKKIIKADITEKLNTLYTSAKESGDVRSANAVLTNLAKLNHLYDNSTTINNTIGLINMSQTQAEKLTRFGELPDNIIIVD